MARMILNLAVDPGFAQAGNEVGVGLLVSVTDADGRPYTGLWEKNFTIQLMWDWFKGESVREGLFMEEAKKNFTGEHVEGVYGLVIWPDHNVWSGHRYHIIVQVREDQNRGQMVSSFTIPR